MLDRYEMVLAYHLTLKQAPEALNRIRVDVAAHILAARVYDYLVIVRKLQGTIRGEFVSVNRREVGNVIANDSAHRRALTIRDRKRLHLRNFGFGPALHHAHDGLFPR